MLAEIAHLGVVRHEAAQLGCRYTGYERLTAARNSEESCDAIDDGTEIIAAALASDARKNAAQNWSPIVLKT